MRARLQGGLIMNTDDIKYVNYESYCRKCEYEKLNDYEDPCNECMEWPCREGTEVPFKYKEKETYK